MKKILISAFALFALIAVACNKQNDQTMVRFHNTLGQDITDAHMDFDDDHKTDVGFIPAGGTTNYIEFDYFLTGDDWPMGTLAGVKGGEAFSAWSGLWCGTGVTFKQLEPGLYQIDIVHLGVDSLGWNQLIFAD
ncbi:MAG: hypothetical protein KDD14_07725 [Saprospiraceae bacterium]|nr:hypothetical protein [Saprospiraceae bacterium]